MVDVPVTAESQSGRRILFAWAVIATAIAFTSITVAIFFFIGFRNLSASRRASPFLYLSDTEIPGRYKLLDAGVEVGFITLYSDHSFINTKGEKNPRYMWAIASDALLMTWALESVRFTSIPSPGVYVGLKRNKTITRMEKVQGDAVELSQ
jgi:hypothetical protein